MLRAAPPPFHRVASTFKVPGITEGRRLVRWAGVLVSAAHLGASKICSPKRDPSIVWVADIKAPDAPRTVRDAD